MHHRINISFPWPWEASATREVISFLFEVSLATFFGFSLIEQLIPGLVQVWINLNTVLWGVVLLGVICLFLPSGDEPRLSESRDWRTSLLALVVVCLAGWGAWASTKEVANLAVRLSTLVVLVAFGLTYLLAPENNDQEFQQ